MKLKIDSDAAIYLINKFDWEKEEMDFLSDLVQCVKSGEDLEYQSDA